MQAFVQLQSRLFFLTKMNLESTSKLNNRLSYHKIRTGNMILLIVMLTLFSVLASTRSFSVRIEVSKDLKESKY